jgi:hypothetical protein
VLPHSYIYNSLEIIGATLSIPLIASLQSVCYGLTPQRASASLHVVLVQQLLALTSERQCY